MKVSIITVTYNSASTLKDTIESVLKQTYSEIEYIIIDGKSTDSTISIIKDYEPKFNGKLKWISESDNGIYDAMNKGINMASGDIIGILNSDDFFSSPEIIEKITRGFQRSSTDAIYGDIHYIKDSDPKKCSRYYSGKPFRRKWMRFGFMPPHPSFYIKKSCLSKYGAYDTSYDIAADFEFLLRLIFIKKIRTQYISIDMVTMRAGGVSTSGMDSHKKIMSEHLRAFRENKIYTNRILLSLRYPYKLWEICYFKYLKGFSL